VERAFRPGKLLFGALERFWPYFWALERRSGAFRLTLMRVHTGDKPHKCSLCNKCYGYLSGLQSHKRQVHSNRD